MSGAALPRSRRAGLLAVAAAGACLDPNPDFDGPATSTGPVDASESSTAAADTSATCEPDGFEPNDDQEAPIQIGSFSVILETVSGRDLYNYFVDDVGSGEFLVVADADVRVCVFVGCEGSFDPAVIECQAPATSGSSEAGHIGCCGGPAAGLAYACAAEMGAKFHLQVDQANADCTAYQLDVATALP